MIFVVIGVNGFFHFMPGIPPPGPAAIVVLGAVLANVLTFHITMAPESISPAIVAPLLWLFVAWSIRGEFATLLARKLR